jgi:hypothetical protein
MRRARSVSAFAISSVQTSARSDHARSRSLAHSRGRHAHWPTTISPVKAKHPSGPPMTLRIRRSLIGAAVFIVLTAISALADPVGTYELSGANPGNGSEYSGTVTVQRNGDTFLVIWTFAGSRQVGIGIGRDDLITVSYRSGNSIGIAVYRPDGDGGKGIWAPAGSQNLGTEVWTRRRSD